MKFGIYKILGVLVFVFFVFIFKMDVAFSENKYCINSAGYCVEQQFPSPRYVVGECSRDYTVDILGEQACNNFLNTNYSFCLSSNSSCKLRYNIQCDSENGQKFAPNPSGLILCTTTKTQQNIVKYCKCNADKSVCNDGASLKSDCDRIVQDSNGQFTQCISTTIDKNCSTLVNRNVVSIKFCSCKSDKSTCDPRIFEDKSTCENNKIDANFQCIVLEGDRSCDFLVESTQVNPGSVSGTEFLAELSGSIKGLNKLSVKNIPELIGKVISTLMGILGSIALLFVIYAGLLWMTAAGNGDKTKKAIDILVWATLGIVVIFASYAIVNLVFETFI